MEQRISIDFTIQLLHVNTWTSEYAHWIDRGPFWKLSIS